MVQTEDWAETSEGFRLYLVQIGSSGETVRTYVAYGALAWRWFAARDLSLLFAERRQLVTFRLAMEHSHTKNTVRNWVCALRAFFRFCIVEGWRADNPTEGISIRKPKQQPRQPLSPDEVRELYLGATAAVDQLMVALLAGTGIRIGELIRIKVSDIDWRREVIVVHGKGNKERYVALTPFLVGLLHSYTQGRPGGPLLLTNDGRGMSRERARKRLALVGERVGVPHVYPHRFRITFITEMLQAGADIGAVQVMAGHSQIEQTVHYAGFTAATRALDLARRYNPADRLVR